MASRLTGFIRDIFLAALMGAGHWRRFSSLRFACPICFAVYLPKALLTPPLCRYFPSAWPKRESAAGFCGQIFSVLLAALAVFTLLAEIFMPALVLALAQGFAGDDEKFALAALCAHQFSLFDFHVPHGAFAAMLNAVNRFFAAALAPVCSIWCSSGRWLWRCLTACRRAMRACLIM